MPSFESIWTGFRHFIRNLLRRSRVERELADEMDAYVDQLTDEKVAQGMSRDEALRAARNARRARPHTVSSARL